MVTKTPPTYPTCYMLTYRYYPIVPSSIGPDPRVTAYWSENVVELVQKSEELRRQHITLGPFHSMEIREYKP